jgi:hypothetical protein
MMLVSSIAMVLLPLLTIALGVAQLFGPGWFFVRRWSWPPTEALAASVGLSLVLIFVPTFLAHWAGAGGWADWTIRVAAVLLLVASWRDAREMLRDPGVRRMLAALAALAAWTVVLLTLVRQYGGGSWCCDWLEHYQRTQHFSVPWPDDFRFIGVYPFSTRPPLMNAVAAHLMGPMALSFAAYQVTFSVLNILLFLPCCLLARRFSPVRAAADPWLVAIVLAWNPMFFMNTTYAWTKALTAFYILLALAIYLSLERTGAVRRATAAFVAMAAAVLTHYSAVPVAAALGVHWLLVGYHRADVRRSTAVAAVLPSVLLVSLWIGHSITASGTTIWRNVSVAGTEAATPAEHASIRFQNLRDTFVPRRYEGYRDYPADATAARRVADQIVTWYQSNLLFSMGSIGAFAVPWLAASLFRRRAWPGRLFWTVGIVWLCLVGVLAHGDREPSGLAMIALQPITYLALSFLVGRLSDLRPWARRLWCVGLVVDALLGVALAVHFQRAEGQWARTPNWQWKADAGVRFLGDIVSSPFAPLTLIAIAAVAALYYLYRNVLTNQPAGVVDPSPSGS